MSTTIVTKNGSGAPLAGNLVQGELAVDLTNKRLYTEDSGGSVIEVGTNPSTFAGATIADLGTVTTADINGGTIDGTVIGGTTAAAGTFTTLTTSGAVTHDGGTANGVSYLNGSKVLTTGSALTFDGSTLGLISAGLNTQNTTSDTVNPITASTNQIRMGASGFVSFRLGTAYDFNIDSYNSASPINLYNVTQDGTHKWSAGGTEAMRIDSSGNVGINNSSPAAPLDILAQRDTTADLFKSYTVNVANTSGTQFEVETTHTGEIAFQGQGLGGASGNAYFAFDLNGTERMRISASGNVGIGTSSPQDSLHVAGDIRTDNAGYIVTEDNAGNAVRMMGINSGNVAYIGPIDNGATFSIFNAASSVTTSIFYTSGTERMRIDSSGNLLVGTTTATLASSGCRMNASGRGSFNSSTAGASLYLDRSGNGELVYFAASGSDAGGIDVTAGGTPAFSAASDARLKENVVNLEGTLKDIMDLRPVSFRWKEERGGGEGEGFIAQEVREVWPDLVRENDDNDYLKILGLGKVETRLIKAIQEQQEIIEELRARVATLEGN